MSQNPGATVSMGPSKSPPERAQCEISHPYERKAVVLLFQAGWNTRELAMVFEVARSTIDRLLDAEEVAR